MKRLFLMLGAVALMIGLVSCGEKQEELTKTIPASSVKIMGDCCDFFTISDDVKIILTKVSDYDTWEVRAVIPFTKTSEAKSWSELEALPHREKSGYSGMFGFSGCYPEVKFLDVNGTEIDLDLKAIGINELLKSEKMSSEEIAIQYKYESDRKDYEKSKAKYDKVARIKLVVNLDFDKQYANEDPTPKKSATNEYTERYVIINANDLRLRLEPSLNADTYKNVDGKNQHANKGECYRYLNESDEFYKIDYNGVDVWVSKDYTYLSENYIEEAGDSDNNSDAYGNSNTNSSSKNNWNQILDEYENYVDQYIELYKKAKRGDISAMNSYVSILEQSQYLSEKLENASGEMTNAQMKRYLNITQKMSNAMLDD